MKQNNIKTLLALFIAVTVFASSCQKDSGIDSLNTGKASVTISMKGVGIANDNSPKAGLRASTSSGKSVATPAVQRQVVKFNNQFNVTATLREVTTTAPALRASANAKRAEVIDTGEGDVLPLADGTDYTIVVYKDGTEVAREEFTQGEGEHTFELEADTYTFVAYAYGDASASGADRDPLWWTADQTVEDGPNTLEIVLEHQLTEVTVVFNAGAEREITAITAGTLAPNHDYTFDEETGIVTFGAATTAASISFAGQTAGQTWTSAPAMIAVEDTDNGIVELTGVTINGIEGSISSDGWALRAGVQYTLELNLGDKEEEGIEIGGATWAPGNLVFVPNNPDDYSEGGTYSFATGGDSDYFNFNGLYPISEDYDYQLIPQGDPCAEMGAGWKTPSAADFEALVAEGYSLETQGGIDGVLIGGVLFMPHLGYLDGAGGLVSDENRYWTSDSGQYFASVPDWNWAGTASGSDLRWGYPIRCVRN